MIEMSLVLLFLLFLALLFILISLFFYLIVKKYQNNQLRQRINAMKDEYRLAVFHYLQNGESEFLGQDLGEEKVKALIELLSDYSHVLTGPEVEEKIHLFAKEHLSDFIKKELTKKRWSLRMNALFAIEDFYMEHLVPILHKLYGKRGTTLSEKAQILKLLAAFNDSKIVDYIKGIDQELSEFSLVSILSSMNDDKLDELFSCLDELPKRTQYILVEMIGKKQLTEHHSLLQKLVLQDETELRIRALKAYVNSGIPIDAAAIDGFFEEDNWQLRMMAARVAGMQRLDLYKDRLLTLLSDREYVVRAEAAKAILRFKEGEAILKKVTDESKDIFAKDMAVEWLEKGRGGYTY
ncbi:HEAT repeat domain-containing protein [Niallia oryzisoli]|uniref:HEAT repeat domain-containing protein n=1 Tax=Niallia oryzisoli TaxID=1737571 RepID=UPI003736AF35